MSIPKIDAHQHFWLYNEEEYSWIGPDDYILKRNYLPSDLAHHLDNLGYSGKLQFRPDKHWMKQGGSCPWQISINKSKQWLVGLI